MERKPSDNFVKVYREILDSSIASDYKLRHFFEDMLKLADWRTGIVDMTPDAISRRINLPLNEVLPLLAELEKPDPQSHTPIEDGRRIVRLDEHRTWGWLIVNYQAYRLTRCAEERREYNRIAQAAHRAKKKAEEAARNGHAKVARSIEKKAMADANERDMAELRNRQEQPQ